MSDDVDQVRTHEQECSADNLCARCEQEEYDDHHESDDRDEEDCWDCGGEGYVLGDCGEDSCCCADPESQHPMVLCSTCRGKG